MRSGQSGRRMWKGGPEAKSLGPQQPRGRTWISPEVRGAATQFYWRMAQAISIFKKILPAAG